MDANRLDAFVRFLTDPSSRRSLLGLSLAGGLGALLDVFDAEAKKNHKKKKKKHKKCKPGCEGGSCQKGQCVCPFSGPCSPGVCCATGQWCSGGSCEACPVGVTPCDVALVCGETPGGNPCTCATTTAAGGETACIGSVELLRPAYCIDCETNAFCENLLGLPGQAVCIGGLDCLELCGVGNSTGCAVNGCVDVEFCDNTTDCSSGECIQHRCQ